MNRREFMAALMAGAVVVGGELYFPNTKAISIPSKKIFRSEGIYMDYATKTIKIEPGPNNKCYTVLDLHRWLQDQADNLEVRDDELCILDPTPSTRVTDNIISLENDWYVTNPEHLSEGSITQRGELWAGVKSIGEIGENTVPNINGIPAVRPGHINQCVKTEPGDKVCVTVTEPGSIYSRFNMSLEQGTNYAPIIEQKDLNYKL